MIEQYGSTVKILNTVIPAANIQVENVPGYLDHPDGTKAWYGVYFEVMWEDARSWTMEQGSEESDPEKITLTEWRWTNLQSGEGVEGLPITLKTWDEFIALYNEKRLSF